MPGTRKISHPPGFRRSSRGRGIHLPIIPTYGAVDLHRRYPLHLAMALGIVATVCILLLMARRASYQPATTPHDSLEVHSHSIPLPLPGSTRQVRHPKKRPIHLPRPTAVTPAPQEVPAQPLPSPLLEGMQNNIQIDSNDTPSQFRPFATPINQDDTVVSNSYAGHPDSINMLSEILYVQFYTRTRVEIIFTANVDSLLHAHHASSKYPNPYARDVQTLFRRPGYVDQNAHVSLVKINDSYAVNVPKIYQITDTHVVLENGQSIAITPQYRTLLLKRIQAYIAQYGQWPIKSPPITPK